MRAKGGCHCGAVRFEVDVDWVSDELIDCNCSICVRKGFLHLIVEPERFELLTDPKAIVEYRFGTETAVHKFCGRCGIHSFYTPRSHPGKVSVNANCLEDFDRDAATIVAFDGQNWEENIDSIADR